MCALESAERLTAALPQAEAHKAACQAKMTDTVDPAVYSEAWLKFQSLDAYCEAMAHRRNQLRRALLAAEQEQAHMAETLRDPRAPEHYRTMHNEAALRSVLKTATELQREAQVFLDEHL
jgi:hypothetical protein